MHVTDDRTAAPTSPPYEAPREATEDRAAVLEARGVSVRYGDDVVLHDVDLTIRRGEFVGLVGPNGSGKTTLLRAFLGLVPVSAGSIRLFEKPLGRFAQWPRIGYVAQRAEQTNGHVFPATVEEVVRFGRVGRRGLFRPLGSADRDRAHQALEAVGMAGYARRRLTELSGGQRQRVLLAKALAGDPDVLLLDEPTTGVDPAARASFYQLIDCLNHDDGITVVLVSHDTQAAVASTHRIVGVNHRIVFDGRPDQLDLDRLYELTITHQHGGEGPHAARR